MRATKDELLLLAYIQSILDECDKSEVNKEQIKTCADKIKYLLLHGDEE